MDSAGLRLGVVTVTYNSANVLGDFIDSVLAQTFEEFHLYAIDNASSDASVELLERIADARVTIVRNRDNLGVAEGNNQGIRLSLDAGCSHVLLLNNDTRFGPSLFADLVQIAVDGGHEIVAPKIYYDGDPARIWFAGGRFLPSRGYSAEHVGDRQLDRGQFDVDGVIGYSPTCCLLVAADVFRKVGIMDASYFVYYDDADFCFRACRAGVKIWYAPRAHLFHKVAALTGGAESPFSARMGVRNKIYFLRKHLGPVRAAGYSLAYFGYLLMRRLVGRDSSGLFNIKMKAFREGLRLSRRPVT
jgi:GT2 family glycosyltransferase